MACRLCAVKPLSEPMLEYSQLNLWEQISVKFESKYNNFHSRKCISKCCLQNGGHLVSISQCVILMYVIWRPKPHLNELSNYDIMELATCFTIFSSIINANYICLWNNKSLMNKQLFLTNTVYLSWFATAGWVCESRFGNYQLFEFDGIFCKFYAYITCRFISTILSVYTFPGSQNTHKECGQGGVNCQYSYWEITKRNILFVPHYPPLSLLVDNYKGISVSS